MQILQQFTQFKQQMNGKDPKAVIDQMIQSGQMSQQQFQQLEQQAQGILSMFRR